MYAQPRQNARAPNRKSCASRPCRAAEPRTRRGRGSRHAAPQACQRSASAPQLPGAGHGAAQPFPGQARPCGSSTPCELSPTRPCEKILRAMPPEALMPMQGGLQAGALPAGGGAGGAQAEVPQSAPIELQLQHHQLLAEASSALPVRPRTPSSCSTASTRSSLFVGCLPRALKSVQPPFAAAAEVVDRPSSAPLPRCTSAVATCLRTRPMTSLTTSTRSAASRPCNSRRSGAGRRSVSAERSCARPRSQSQPQWQRLAVADAEGRANKDLEARAKCYAFY